MSLKCTMILGDCLDVMPTLQQSSAQMVFADLPYGCTAHAWDRPICIDRLFAQLSVVGGADCRLVITSIQPMTSRLVVANIKHFRNEIIWRKGQATNFFQAKVQPLRVHESILVFGGSVYNPIMWDAKKPRHSSGKRACFSSGVSSHGRSRANGRMSCDRYPLSVLDLRTRENKYHPTQKPVALIDWLMRTYSHEGSAILDPTAGSMTTCVAAASSGRSSVAIEKNPSYFAAGVARVREHCRRNLLDIKIEVIT